MSERERALCVFADRLAVAPASIDASAHDALRHAGLDDEARLHLIEVVGYFSFVNRLAEGAGVQIEAGHTPILERLGAALAD